MNPFSALVKGVTDRYELQARLFPGLLVISPLLILLCCVAAPKAPILTGVITAVSTLGLPFAIAIQVRVAGKKLEEHLRAQWGAWPSTIVLRHHDERYNPYTKQHYHQELSRRFDVQLPSAAEESADPIDADHRYTALSDRLRLSLRGKVHPHLRRENIAYGFYRNSLALKVPGQVMAAISCLAGALLAGAITTDRPYFVGAQLVHPGYPIAISMGFSIAMLILLASYGSRSPLRFTTVIAT